MSTSLDRIKIIKEIQQDQLILLEQLDTICKKHGIQYFLYWGSLIGAIRHKGFIPWDDDIDIGMLRDDFEKLCNVKADEWGDYCELILPSNGIDFHDKIFARIYVKNSKIQSPQDIYKWKMRKNGKPFSTKLMCDIYVFDYAPQSSLIYKVKQLRMLALGKEYKLTKCIALPDQNDLKTKLKVSCKNVIGNILCTIYNCPWEVLASKSEAIAKSKHQTKHICCYCDGGESTLASIDNYFPLKYVKFEGLEIPIPKEYDKLLRAFYGDYMIYPNQEDRYHISFNYLKLGNGKEYIVENIPNSLGDKNCDYSKN